MGQLEGLDGLFKGLESQDSWQAQRQFRIVVQHWPKVVGFAVARKTRPICIQRQSLQVATETAAWAQTLTYERLRILKKLNRYQTRPIRNIRFSTAQWHVGKPADPTQIATRHPSYTGQLIPPAKAKPSTPSEAFETWAAVVQQMQQGQAVCPKCQCRCPQGELDRWALCSLCAAKQWH